jgi:hypothetical protein
MTYIEQLSMVPRNPKISLEDFIWSYFEAQMKRTPTEAEWNKMLIEIKELERNPVRVAHHKAPFRG